MAYNATGSTPYNNSGNNIYYNTELNTGSIVLLSCLGFAFVYVIICFIHFKIKMYQDTRRYFKKKTNVVPLLQIEKGLQPQDSYLAESQENHYETI